MGHQIIQTSCRRGISGGGSGFQVFSCDEELAHAGYLNGAEYQRLFVYDTPVEVGISSFGYAYVDGVGSIFSLNTRLAHDFAGAGTRSGNLLNHSILVDDSVDFYPAELFGSPMLRAEMDESEVNNEDAPDYLPSLAVAPAGTISIGEIGCWLDEHGGAERLERLLGAYFAARSEGKALIILDAPVNVVRWVAALEYCLPLKLARTINFVSYSENAANVKANIAGTSRDLFEANTPSYMLASIVVFDPEQEEEHALPEGSFIDFVDVSYSLNPSVLSQFTGFVNSDLDIEGDLTLEELNDVHAVYSLIRDDVSDWSSSAIRNGLSCALACGTEELNGRIGRIIEDNRDAVAALDSDSYLEILEYLIRRWPSLDEEGKRFVEGVVIGNVMGLLQQKDVDESVYQDYFEAITRSCASAGLNVFEILMGEESRTRLILAAQKLSLARLRLFADSLTQFVIVSEQPLDGLAADAPLGSLYACLLECAFAQGSVAGTSLAQCVVSSSSAKLAYLENLTMTIDWAVRRFFHCSGNAGSVEEQAAIDAIWDLCVTLIAERHADEITSAAKWLVWAAGYDRSRFGYLADLYERLSLSCRNVSEALDLFSAVCPEGAFADESFATDAYPRIASRFALLLRRYDDEDSAEAARSLLESSLNSQFRFDFIPSLMEMVSKDFGIKKTRPVDLRLIDRAVDYEFRTGGSALSGKAALIKAANLLEEAPRGNDPVWAIQRLEGLSASLDVGSLDERAFKEYVKRVAPAAAKAARSSDDFSRIVGAFGLYGGRLTLLLREAFDCAMKEFDKRGNATPLIALTSYVVIAVDRGIDEVCVRAIANVKTEDDLYHVDYLTRSALRTSGAASVERWGRIFSQAQDRRGQGFFVRFRR